MIAGICFVSRETFSSKVFNIKSVDFVEKFAKISEF